MDRKTTIENLNEFCNKIFPQLVDVVLEISKTSQTPLPHFTELHKCENEDQKMTHIYIMLNRLIQQHLDDMYPERKGEKYICCLCGQEDYGMGNNPYPLCKDDDYTSRCCKTCDDLKVIPKRIENSMKSRRK